MKITEGHRRGKLGQISLSVVAVAFDSEGRRVLLTRRRDNGTWCLPGGCLEPGESLSEACVREFLEESGLEVRVTHLLGVYSSPHRLVQYDDGRRFQVVLVCFLVEATGGTVRLSLETTDVRYLSMDDLDDLDVLEGDRGRIADALAFEGKAFIR